MLIVNVTKEKNLESALKKYKYKVQKNRQKFVKPSVVKRSQKLKAIYKQEIISNQEKSN